MAPNGRTRQDQCDAAQGGAYKIKTYRPTIEQMKDFSAYIKFIHEDGGHRAGLAKIIPPEGYTARKAGYQDDKLYGMTIPNPIEQRVMGSKGIYTQYNCLQRKKFKVREFMRQAEDKYPTPEHKNSEDLERAFWKNVSITAPSIYGADVPGTLFDDDVEEFNLTKLNTLLDDIKKDYGITIQGVNTTYLYFGMWKTAFSWHTEDMDLYSINYLHFGQPKSWYSIPPEHGKRFERLAENFFSDKSKECKAFLRHKSTMISPKVLKDYSIPFCKCTQEPGEFMITFPFSYHSGYNHGFNIAEATNFAVEYWIDFGKWASRCECQAEAVKISMQTFVKRYQPDRYNLWIEGKDVGPDPREPNQTRHAAPRPSKIDLYMRGNHDTEDPDDRVCDSQETINEQDKPLPRAYPTLRDTVQRYAELFLPDEGQDQLSKHPQMPHYSPIETNLVPIESLGLDANQQTNLLRDIMSPNSECYNFISQPAAVQPPDYESYMIERKQSLKKDKTSSNSHAMRIHDNHRDPFLQREITLEEGAHVVAQHPDRLFYDARILNTEDRVYFDVYYPSLNQTDEEIESENIIDFDPEKTYLLGDRIQVKNTDGSVMDAKVKSQRKVSGYNVGFSDGSKVYGRYGSTIFLNVDHMPDALLVENSFTDRQPGVKKLKMDKEDPSTEQPRT